MADIGSLIVKIGADASGLQKAFSDLGGSAKKFQQGLETIGKIGGTAILAATSAMVAMTVVAGQQAEALTQLSAITGINTDTLQEYDVMLGRVGLGGEDLTVMMRTLSKNMEEANQGTGKAADRFRQLGIDIRKVTSTDDLIRKIAESVSKFANGTEKAAIVTDLLGRSGLKFIPAFEGGAKAINAAAAASKLLGDTLSGTQLQTLGSMDDAFDDLAVAAKRFAQQLGAALAPGIELVIRGFTDMLAVGSKMFKFLELGADVLAIQLTHLGVAATEVARVLFSKDAISPAAWAQVGENLKLINKEANILIANRRAMTDIIPALGDTRAKAPALIDTAKFAQQAQALADAQLKASESLFKNEESLAKARLANYLASLEAAKSAGIRTDEEVSLAKQSALEEMDAFTLDSLNRQLKNYQTFSEHKMKLFTGDEKGQADRLKFATEASQKEKELIAQIAVAQVAADTVRIQSGQAVLEATKKTRLIPLEDELALATADFNLQKAFYAMAPGMIGAANAARQKGLELIETEAALRAQVIEQTIKDEIRKNALLIALDGETQAKRIAMVQQFPDFWQKQLQDVVASNTFSVGLIINSWTSGLANAIVNGGDFVKAAWQSTQLAIVQGAINTGVQLAAQYALQASVEMGILTATAAAKLGLKTSTNAAIVASETAAATASVGVWAGASAAIIGWYGTVAAGFATISASLVATVTAVGTFVMGVLSSIASALSATVFGIPYAGAILVGIALIAAALAATGNLGFKEGGIGDFGSGTQATLHGPEAIIPLNSRGAAFMREALGGGGGKEQTINIPVNLDGREIAKVTARYTGSAWRAFGAPA